MNKNYLNLFDEIEKEHEQQKSHTLNSRVLLVDGLNTFIRAFSADPSCNDTGVHIGGITGFLKSIGYAIKTMSPTRCVIVFDGRGGSARRRKIYPDYKSKRKPSIRYNRAEHISNRSDENQSMKMQINRLIQYLECLPVTILLADNMEADDAISYIATSNIDNEDSEFIIMSADKDFYQLIDDKITVWSPTKKKLYNRDNLFEEYNITASNFLMYRVLDGDKSDNISGIRGAGLKTINKFLPILSKKKAVTVDGLVDYSKDKKGKLYENIASSKKLLTRNFKLMQLRNVDISGNSKMKMTTAFREKPGELVKWKFQTMVLEDTINSAIPNLNLWLSACFNSLNAYILASKEKNG